MASIKESGSLNHCRQHLAAIFPVLFQNAAAMLKITALVTKYLVCSHLKGKFGAFAEYIKVRANAIAIKPNAITHADAAAIPCAGMTSYQTIHTLAKLKPDETILVNGASGGVGTYGVQLAKAHGAKVIAVCSANNVNLCKRLGADDTINYNEANFEDYAASFDVVYDVIGRSSPHKAAASMKPGGRYVTTIPNASTLLAAGKSWLASHILPGQHKLTQLIMVKTNP